MNNCFNDNRSNHSGHRGKCVGDSHENAGKSWGEVDEVGAGTGNVESVHPDADRQQGNCRRLRCAQIPTQENGHSRYGERY